MVQSTHPNVGVFQHHAAHDRIGVQRGTVPWHEAGPVPCRVQGRYGISLCRMAAPMKRQSLRSLRRFPNVRVHVIAEAVGKAMAVRAGWERANGDWVAFLMRWSTSATEFQHIFSARRDADGVIVRAPGAKSRTDRHFGSWPATFALAVKLVLMPYRDTQCGANIPSRTHPAILPFIRVRNIAFDVEILLLCRQAGASIVNTRHWVDRSDSVIIGSPSKLIRSSLAMLGTLLTLRMFLLHCPTPMTQRHVIIGRTSSLPVGRASWLAPVR